MRVDDLVRTERHFCALLLSLLLDEELAGVRALVDLLVAEGILGHRPSLPEFTPETVQVIAELAVRRDLQKHAPDAPFPAESPRDVVDVVVIVGGLLIAVEAKFFSPTDVAAVRSQLATQREALRLLEARAEYGITRVCQVLLTADLALDAAQLPGAGVLRWTDVCALAERLRGPGSYVARRLRSALDRYQEELGPDRPGPYWVGAEPFEAIRRRCRVYGPGVVVGFLGGLRALQTTPPAALRARRYRWDWADAGRGRKVRQNWLPGDAFAAAVDALDAGSGPRDRNEDPRAVHSGAA